MKKLLTLIAFGVLFSCNTGQKNAEVKKDNQDSSAQLAADSLCSFITCPHCKYKKSEKLPTEICLLKYTCDSCSKEIFPKEGDCCVFCSYGDKKCPSMQ